MEDGRECVRYSCHKVQPDWRRLAPAEREQGRMEFAAIIEELGDNMLVRSYSLMGTRGDADFMLWSVAESLEQLQELSTRLYSTRLGAYLETPFSYLAMTKRSMYLREHRHEGQEGSRLKIKPVGSKYLFVYPFIKSREWYLLPFEQRQEMMSKHIAVGHKYPKVKINTGYSFGIDDQEFVVAFEAESPGDFLDLVMELRGTKASQYTVRDTPAFSGVAMPIAETLRSLGG